MRYRHHDHDITFDQDTATFSAFVNGECVTRTSLASVKKHIDHSIKETFTPFEALDCRYRTPSLNKVLVIGIEKTKKRGNKRSVWKLHEKQSMDSVIADTPENVAKIREYLKNEKENDIRQRRHEKKQEAILKSIPRLFPPKDE